MKFLLKRTLFSIRLSNLFFYMAVIDLSRNIIAISVRCAPADIG